jgi:hypothetical protein
VRDSEIKIFEKRLIEKSHWNPYISGERGGTPIQLVALEVGTFVKVPNGMKLTNVGDSITRVLAPDFRLFPKEADMAFTTMTCATALACDTE